MILLLGMMCVSCKKNCSICNPNNINHSHTRNHGSHNKQISSSMVPNVTLDPLLKRYTVNLVVCNLNLWYEEICSNKTVMNLSCRCRKLLNEPYDVHVLLRKCIDTIMKKLTSLLNCQKSLNSKIHKKCHPAMLYVLNKMFVMIMMILSNKSAQKHANTLVTFWSYQKTALSCLNKKFSAKITLHLRATHPRAYSDIFLSSHRYLGSLKIKESCHFFAGKIINLSAKENEVTFWYHMKCYFSYQNKRCHQKISTYLHSLYPNAHFDVFLSNFCGLVNPKFDEISKESKIFQFFMTHVTLKQGQGHAPAHLTRIVSTGLSNEIDTNSKQNTTKNGFFQRNQKQFRNFSIQIKNIINKNLLHHEQTENKQTKTGNGSVFFNFLFLAVFPKIQIVCHHDQYIYPLTISIWRNH